jgi:hypothetical protein
MSKQTKQASAFPSTTHTAEGHVVNGPEFGLTKRELFALHLSKKYHPAYPETREELAAYAVKHADALLAELEKKYE